MDIEEIKIKLEFVWTFCETKKVELWQCYWFIVSMLSDMTSLDHLKICCSIKNNSRSNHHKCTIWDHEEANSQEYELCRQLVENGY